jgi:hypothetical protein
MANPVVFYNAMFALSTGTPTSSGHLVGTKEITFPFAFEELDDSAMGDLSKAFYPGMQTGDAVTVRVRQDFSTATSIDPKIYTWFQAKAALNFKIRAVKAAVSSTNPTYGGKKYYITNYPPIQGAHGAALDVTITLKPGSNSSASGIYRSTST